LSPAAVIGLLTVGLSRLQRVIEVLRSRRFITLGRIVLIVIVLVALPSFLISVGDILGSSA